MLLEHIRYVNAKEKMSLPLANGAGIIADVEVHNVLSCS